VRSLAIGSNVSVQGRLHFKDASMSTSPANSASDPYFMEKVVDSSSSHLRLTLNDDPDESLQIWGNSCKSVGGCSGPGVMQHRFTADGSASHAGSLSIGSNLAVQGRLHFKDATMSTIPSTSNASDPYYLEKVVDSSSSHLRLTLNDDPDESLQIWGNSCKSTGGCTGPGQLQHRFTADGSASHAGGLTLGGKLCLGNTCLDEAALKKLLLPR
jgi:hypothetical protein